MAGIDSSTPLSLYTLSLYTHSVSLHTLSLYTHSLFTHTLSLHTLSLSTHSLSLHTHALSLHTLSQFAFSFHTLSLFSFHIHVCVGPEHIYPTHTCMCLFTHSLFSLSTYMYVSDQSKGGQCKEGTHTHTYTHIDIHTYLSLCTHPLAPFPSLP